MRLLEKHPNIDIFPLLQAPSSSTASTRSPLLCPTVSSTQVFHLVKRHLSIALHLPLDLQETRRNKTADSYNSRRVPQRSPQPQQEPQARPLDMPFGVRKEMESEKDLNVAP
jgi:hypothetical protein